MTPRFDPTRALVFDLARGQLRDEEGAARVNLPYHVLARLCEQAGAEAARDFAHSLGVELGRRVVERLGKDAVAEGLVAWAEHLGGQLALLGLGSLQLERWGRALVLRAAGYPAGAEPLLAPLLSSALGRATGRELALVPFVADGSAAYLVVAPGTAERARRLASAGNGLGQVVEELHRGAA
jgi:hypothetical protein